jgi:hypothetical protein
MDAAVALSQAGALRRGRGHRLLGHRTGAAIQVDATAVVDPLPTANVERLAGGRSAAARAVIAEAVDKVRADTAGTGASIAAAGLAGAVRNAIRRGDG